MKCPVDNETLVMTDRSGVEIDYCPKCRGVWLDRGELDKIIDRAAAAPAAQQAPQQNYQPQHQHPQYQHQHPGHKPYYKKRESFLGELFDF
jgi:hypothetical protein